MGTAKCNEVNLGRDQKNVPQHGVGIAGANKPQHEGRWRAQSLGLASLLGIDPPLHSGSRGSGAVVTLCFELVSPSGSKLTL